MAAEEDRRMDCPGPAYFANSLSPTQPYQMPAQTPCRSEPQPAEVFSFILQWDHHLQLLRSFLPSDTWMLTVATLCRQTELAIHPHTRSLGNDYKWWREGIRQDTCSSMCAPHCEGGAGKHTFTNPRQGHGWARPCHIPWLDGRLSPCDEDG